ncbi:MAG: FAD binding domain-containing protein [Candidatus Izemoplasmatales bacterium]|jgi:CO/xanthine dehydrogenase FAD-binding subunit|nr:FAD binding domain-containing protein [Candidatus Izemoplasmatales bacterium]
MVEAYIPKTLDECLNILNEKEVKIVAGGTDMLIQNRSHTSMPIGYKKDIVYISNLEELKKIYEDDSFIYIGASVVLEEIMENSLIPKLLRDTILEIASPAIRHTATLAGNIGNASPAGDSLVPLYLMSAEVEIKSVNITRRVFLKDFIKGVRKIALESNEMITKVILPKLDFSRAYFKKVGPRLSDAISKLSFGGAYRINNNQIEDIRIAFGAVNIYVVRDRNIELKLINKTVDEINAMKEKIVSWYEPLIKPIDDQRSNKEYRKLVALNLLRDFIDNIE